MRPGEVIVVTARKADGTPYRWWEAEVESLGTNYVITRLEPGQVISEPNRTWVTKVYSRTFYWHDHLFNLTETYLRPGMPERLYVNIASPFEVRGSNLNYKDYELDVVKNYGSPAYVLDEDEFAAAVTRYGLEGRLVDECRRAVEEAQKVVNNWRWQGLEPSTLGVDYKGSALRKS